MPICTLVLGLMLAPPSSDAQITQYVEGYRAKNNIPGIAMAITRKGEIVYSKGFGFADREAKKPVQIDTEFLIGSVTKQFTSAALMMLVEEGKVDLEKPITEYLDWVPKTWSDIKLTHLLTHTSGLFNYTDDGPTMVFRRKALTDEELVQVVSKHERAFKPGEKMVYCNTGYYLLGRVIEKVSGEPYEGFLKRRIFAPLGMNSTYMYDMDALKPELSKSYWVAKERVTTARLPHQMMAFSAGSLASTVVDLAKWDKAMWEYRLVKQETWKKMWSPFTLNSGAANPYGYAWMVSNVGNHPAVEHSGGIPSFSAHIRRYLKDGISIIVLQNTMSMPVAMNLVDRVAHLVIPDIADPDAAPIKIEDKNPELTKAHRTLYESLLTGSMGDAKVTEAMKSGMTPAVLTQVKGVLKAIGSLKEFVLTSRREEQGSTISEYTLVGSDKKLTLTVVTDASGVIAGLWMK
ncbi:MAG: beta-lactamase family protein [Armatimonadetes bacterium]|nr:beta-lactamase family protein [Armatimonadota bacterium]